MDGQTTQILELLPQPAFIAAEQQVCWCNAAARSLLLENASLPSLLGKSAPLFESWNGEGTLQLCLTVGLRDYDASARNIAEGTLFIATPQTSAVSATANAVVSASAAFRKPLQSMLSAAEQLCADPEGRGNAETAAAAALMNRSIYQMLRLCGQMSDGGRLLLHKRHLHRQSVELDGFFRSFMEQAQPLVQTLGVTLEYEPLSGPLRAHVDTALLERCLYNLISNSLNYTKKGGNITISPKKQGKTLLIRVTDDGEGIADQLLATLPERFTELPAGDARWGIGMGLPMVRQIAQLHGGTMVIAPNAGGQGTCVTFSLRLEASPNELRSAHPMAYDYCGGLHHGLVELSDVLGTELFLPGEV